MLDGLFDFNLGALLPFLVIVIVGLLFAYLGSRYKVPKANEALIVSGRRERSTSGEQRLRVVRGQGTIVLPLLHRVGTLKLTARQIGVNLNDAVTRQGIKVAVQGVATFKIGADNESIQNAAERFLDSRDEEVDSIVKNVLEGSLRSIVGTLTVEELNLDRMKFQQAVQDAAKGDLSTSGLQIDSFTIQAIRDESGYMELIGQQETARRERDARMAKAAADQEAAVREAEANQVKINADRDVSIRRAETEQQIAAAEARAAQAGPLAQAEAQQEVTRKQTELAQLEADRKQQELVASTVRPAEAEAEAQIRRAEGEKQSRIAAAQADAERVKLAGEAQARVVEVTAEATAKQTTLEGTAEAGIVLSKGEAEARALALRAEAYRQFNEAAVIQTVLSQLPEIVRAAAEPMGNIGSLTVLSSDGASDVVRNTTRTVAEAGAAVKGLTGIDIPGLLAGAMGSSSTNGGPASPHDGGSSGDGGRELPRRTTPAPSAPPAQASAITPVTPPMSVTPATSAPAAGAAAAPAPDPGAAFERAARQMSEASRRVSDTRIPPLPPISGQKPPTGLTDRAIDPPRPAPGVGQRPTAATPATARITAETPLDEAAALLAADLDSVPGIERFGGVRLGELDRSGPRPLRLMWRLARGQLSDRYGDVTVGELLARHRGRGGGSSASA